MTRTQIAAAVARTTRKEILGSEEQQRALKLETSTKANAASGFGGHCTSMLRTSFQSWLPGSQDAKTAHNGPKVQAGPFSRTPISMSCTALRQFYRTVRRDRTERRPTLGHQLDKSADDRSLS